MSDFSYWLDKAHPMGKYLSLNSSENQRMVEGRGCLWQDKLPIYKNRL
jgi:hypothetical protein